LQLITMKLLLFLFFIFINYYFIYSKTVSSTVTYQANVAQATFYYNNIEFTNNPGYLCCSSSLWTSVPVGMEITLWIEGLVQNTVTVDSTTFNFYLNQAGTHYTIPTICTKTTSFSTITWVNFYAYSWQSYPYLNVDSNDYVSCWSSN